jgi:hypothetical protein
VIEHFEAARKFEANYFMREKQEALLAGDWLGSGVFAEAKKIAARRCKTSAPAVFVLLWAVCGWASTSQSELAQSNPFPTATVHFEQNATDGDVEVVFKVKAKDEGLSELKIISPDGRTVVDFRAPEYSTLGVRQFDFESPEPPDVESLKAAYPEGVYEFFGATSSGDKLAGRSSLNHRLPKTAEFTKPANEDERISVRGSKLSWSQVEDVAYYILEVEQDELKMNLTAFLPAATTSFILPDGLLLTGEEYELAIGTVSEEGNISFIETSFTTSD